MRLRALLLMLAMSPAWASAELLTFDNLVTPPGSSGSLPFDEANGGSLVYGGVTWDINIRVVGNQYASDPAGPRFGIPHSGAYYIANGSGTWADVLGSVFLQTDKILTESWWASSEYYGYGGGADRITLNALSGTTVLASIEFDLPLPIDSTDCRGLQQPHPMAMLDSSSFLSLTGITGYRIDRHAPSEFQTNWVADDFRFVSAAVPEPSSLSLAGLGCAGLVVSALRRRQVGAI